MVSTDSVQPPRHLIGIESLSRKEIATFLDAATPYFSEEREPSKRGRTLAGKTVVTLFFEASTRTRASFELAAKRLGADVVNLAPATSSFSKGETLLDSIRNLESMHADAIIMRHPSSGAAEFVAQESRACIINAGDGAHEHPTQALLDAWTIRRHRGAIAGLTVAICGDILHSRVARSNTFLLSKLGAFVRLCGPPALLPRGAEALGPGVSMGSSLEKAVEQADVVMMLRLQNERFTGATLPSTREYARTFGLTSRVLEGAKGDALVMHPGPINRGVELDSGIADGKRSVILEQVQAGVAVRMATLDVLLAGAR